MVKKKQEKTPVESKKSVKIPSLSKKVARITIEGLTPLLVNRFDEKTRKQIEDDYQKKGRTKQKALSPKEQYENSLYILPGKKNVFCVPAAALKNCAVSACRFVEGVPMTVAKGAFHVINDIGGYIQIKGKPTIDERLVRVGNFGNKKPATRYRGRFDKWEITFDILYNEGVISPEQLLNLYEHAGFSVGLHEYRPEKNGNMGMFRIKR